MFQIKISWKISIIEWFQRDRVSHYSVAIYKFKIHSNSYFKQYYCCWLYLFNLIHLCLCPITTTLSYSRSIFLSVLSILLSVYSVLSEIFEDDYRHTHNDLHIQYDTEYMKQKNSSLYKNALWYCYVQLLHSVSEFSKCFLLLLLLLFFSGARLRIY